MEKIIITGGNGFIGNALARHFALAGHSVVALSRRTHAAEEQAHLKRICTPNYGEDGWSGDGLITKNSTIIHTAARAHHPQEKGEVGMAYLNENVLFTLHLARIAQRSGAKRFIFLSSIGAQLLETALASGMSMDKAWQKHPYRASKLEAEKQLAALVRETGFEIVSIRMPLVYGKDAPGNLQTLLSWLKRGKPLPFANIKNARAFLSVETLTTFITHVMAQPNASGVWAIRDADMPSTPEFTVALAEAAKTPAPKLFFCPVFFLKLLGAAAGRGQQMESLTESLPIDLTAVREKLGWKPTFSTREGLIRAFS